MPWMGLNASRNFPQGREKGYIEWFYLETTSRAFLLGCTITFGPNSGYLVCVWDRSRDLARLFAKDGLGTFGKLRAMQGEGLYRVLLPRNHIAHYFFRVYIYLWAKFGLLGMWGG